MDERAQAVEDLRSRRETLNEQAHRERELRDRMNDETKRHAVQRDELNARVRETVAAANAHKAKRDALNADVRAAKQLRDQLNADAQAKTQALHEMRGTQHVASPGVSTARLKAEIRQLEFQQQTTVLTPKKERDLIDLIALKQKQLGEREVAPHEDPGLQAAHLAMKEAKRRAEEQHALVTRIAISAQAEHDAMVQTFNHADELRKQADAAHGAFVHAKEDADRVHRSYVDDVTAIRDLERVMANVRGVAFGHAAPDAQVQANADDIFDKFRKGEKLSTEDLYALQKAGRL